MVNPPPAPPLPTQRVLDRLIELDAEVAASADAIHKGLDEALTRFQSEITRQLRALEGPGGRRSAPDLPLRSLKELLPVVVWTAALTALATTVVALIIQG